MVRVIAPLSKEQKRLEVASEAVMGELCNVIHEEHAETINIISDVVTRYVITGERGSIEPFDPVVGLAYVADFHVQRMTTIALHALHIRKVANTLSPEELRRAEMLYRRIGVDPEQPHKALRSLRVVR